MRIRLVGVAGVILCCVAMLASTGCESGEPRPRDTNDAALFGPAAMRIHPIFTQIKDWSGDGRADGIDALIELQDQFGDPTKASGQIIFELYEYRPYNPDPRGQRVVSPWVGDLSTLAAQRERWNRTSRTYSFPLEWRDIRENQDYVLTATFQLTNGGRFFDRIILQAKERTGARPTTTPAAPARP